MLHLQYSRWFFFSFLFIYIFILQAYFIPVAESEFGRRLRCSTYLLTDECVLMTLHNQAMQIYLNGTQEAAMNIVLLECNRQEVQHFNMNTLTSVVK